MNLPVHILLELIVHQLNYPYYTLFTFRVYGGVRQPSLRNLHFFTTELFICSWQLIIALGIYHLQPSTDFVNPECLILSLTGTTLTWGAYPQGHLQFPIVYYLS